MTLAVSPPRAPGCVSDLELDELLAGDLGRDSREATVRAHVDGCTRCRARFAAFAAIEPPPKSTMLPRVIQAAAPRSRMMRWRLGIVVATMGAAVAVAAVIARPSAGPDERTKGGLALTVFVKRAGGAVDALTQGGTLQPGDEMRFSLATERPGYAVVLGLDAIPSVTVYAPYAATGIADQPIRLDSAGTTTLPGSIVADETEGAERVVAVVCKAPTRPDVLRARALAALRTMAGDPRRVSSLATGCAERSVLLQKEPRER